MNIKKKNPLSVIFTAIFAIVVLAIIAAAAFYISIGISQQADTEEAMAMTELLSSASPADDRIRLDILSEHDKYGKMSWLDGCIYNMSGNSVAIKEDSYFSELSYAGCLQEGDRIYMRLTDGAAECLILSYTEAYASTVDAILSMEEKITLSGFETEQELLRELLVSTLYYKGGEELYRYLSEDGKTYSLTPSGIRFENGAVKKTERTKMNGKTVVVATEKMPSGVLSSCPFTGLVLTSQVAEVAEYAFSGCSFIRYLYLPETVKTVGDGAFANCMYLGCVDVEGYTQLGDGVFAGTAFLAAQKPENN